SQESSVNSKPSTVNPSGPVDSTFFIFLASSLICARPLQIYCDPGDASLCHPGKSPKPGKHWENKTLLHFRGCFQPTCILQRFRCPPTQGSIWICAEWKCKCGRLRTLPSFFVYIFESGDFL